MKFPWLKGVVRSARGVMGRGLWRKGCGEVVVVEGGYGLGQLIWRLAQLSFLSMDKVRFGRVKYEWTG